ncbi:MAG: hypothetical protein ACK5QX_06755 [bacterium]
MAKQPRKKKSKQSEVDLQQDVFLARIDERLESTDQWLTKIYEEVKKTNGRVTKIENERLPSLENWRARVGGIWFAVTVGSSVIGALAGFALAFLKS